MSAGGFLLEPADRARRRVLRVAAVTAFGRACIRDRSLRLPFLAFVHAGTALVLAAVVPMWTLLVGPLVLGVPHLIADFRYLVLDRPRGLADRQVLGILVPLAALAAVNVAFPGASSLSMVIPGLAAIAGGIAFASGSTRVRLFAFALLAACAIPLCAQPGWTLLILAHAHNAIAVGLWLAIAPSRTPLRWAAAAVILLGGVAITLGALDAVPLATGGWQTPVAGFDANSLGDSLALPGLGPARSLMLYAYAQAVHYAIWVRLIPGERALTEAPVSFRRALGGLRAALGSPAFAVCLVVALALPAAGLAFPAESRRIYLDLAGFHAWLELAIGAHFAIAWTRRA